jgi:hypothetical protein
MSGSTGQHAERAGRQRERAGHERRLLRGGARDLGGGAVRMVDRRERARRHVGDDALDQAGDLAVGGAFDGEGLGHGRRVRGRSSRQLSA